MTIQSLSRRDEYSLSDLSLSELSILQRRLDWVLTARPDQIPPEQYFVWLLLAGRGSGKTRAGAEDIWWPAAQETQRVAVVAPTHGDVRRTCFEGESGLLACIPKQLVQNYTRNPCELTMTNGSYFVGYSAEEPERLRGPQHHRAWCDELAAWRYLDATWDMLMFGLRLGAAPSVIVTTTPKPSRLLKELARDADTKLSRASTFDNSANLPKKFLERLRKKYAGTRLGRQELDAEILDDNPWAMWQREWIDSRRIAELPELSRVVVGVDPPASSGPDADECGIVVAGREMLGHTFCVIQDESCQGLSPEGWAQKAVSCYRVNMADAIVAEVNNGGDMVESTIKHVDPSVNVIKVHATRGKVRRAEPISALYEQRRVHHLGYMPTLEQQMCEFTSDFDPAQMGYSPDRVDALVWALTELSDSESFDVGEYARAYG